MNQFNNFQDNEQALAKPYAALESSSTSPSIGLLITSHNLHDDHWKDISSYSQHSCNHLLEPQSNTSNSYCCARSSSKTNVSFCISMLTFSIVIVVCLLTLFHFALSFLTTQQEHFHKSQSISSSNAVCGVTCVHGDCIVDLINGDFCSCHPGYTQDACDNVLFDFDSDQALLSTVASELVTLNPTNCFDVFKDYNPAFGLDYDCYSRNSKFYVQLGPEHLVFPKYFNTSGAVKIRINALPRQTPQTILEVVPMVGVGALVRTSKSYRFSPNAQLSYKFFTQDTSSSEFVKNINTPNFVLAPDSVKSTTVTFSVNITQRGLVWNTTTSSTEFNTGYSPPNFLYTTNEFTCNGVNCFLEAFLTGPKNAFTTTFSFDGSIANSLSGYQLIKLSSSMVPSSVKTGSILTIGATSLSEKPIPERNVNVSFADISVIISSFYVLTGGGVTQSISGGNVMIAVTSTDSVNYPLSLISNLAVTWQCNGPTGSNCGLVSQGLSASIANANLKIGSYVISVTIGGFTTLTTNVQIVDSAPLPVTLSPIPPFTSKGSSIKFSAVIYVTTSLSISFNIFQNNVKLSDAPIYLATQEKSSYYLTGEFPTTNTIPYSPLQITMYLNGNSFNFTTTIMPKPLRFGTCFVYPDAGTIYAYETVLTLTCTSPFQKKMSNL
ncbi:hypothetical protein C9374_012140 [Naegleria lovaniensis]|uniref:EGF-like domain-containing protein n=1 Tax=Naegleria lovaniensis TaxID=51637 RepID=A0AA88KEP1_NAELO|nr:uncharacterized protein C9374_012140 [Naegleria lovaniensis]KAG2373401.1 hypothetical protein C9374_012140 [Naegleria lovaniensis]